MNIGDVWLQVRADLSQFQASMANLNSQVSRTATDMGRSMQRVGAATTRIGQSMLTNVTLPIVAAGGAAAHFALDFDTTLRRVVGLTDITAESIGGIREAILAMGPAVGKTPQELAEAFYFVASAGFKADEALNVLEVSAKASASGLGETKTIAMLLGGVINAYGRENITAARAADILTESVSQGTAEASTLAGIMGNVVPGAAALGVSFDQVGAAIAGMTLSGVGAEESVTSLTQIFSSLLKPTSQAEEAMEGLGLSSSELRRQLREEGLLATLRTLEERFAGNEQAAGAVFGNIRALRGVTALLGLDSEQLNTVFEKVNDSLGRSAEAYSETEGPQRAMDRALADLQVTAIQIGDDVLPMVVDVLQEVAGAARELGKWWRSLDDATKKNIVQWLAWAAIAGPVLMVVGKLVSAFGFLFKGIGFLTGAKGIPLLIKALGSARLAALGMLGPIGAIIAAALALNEITGQTEPLEQMVEVGRLMEEAGVGADVFRAALEDSGLSIKDFNDRLLEMISDGASAEEALRLVASGVEDFSEGTRLSLAEAGEAWRGFDERSRGITGSLESTVDEAALIAAGLPPEIAAALAAGAPAVGDAADLSADEIQAAMEQARTDAVAAMTSMISDLASVLATGPEEIRDEMDAFRDALLNPYDDTRRRYDLEGSLAATAFADALSSGDSRLEAEAFTRINDLIAQYELIEPGALAAGHLINPAFSDGINDNLDAMLDWVADNVAAPYLDTMTLPDALRELGYDGLAAYADAVAEAERIRLSQVRNEIRRQSLEDLNMNDEMAGLGSGAGKEYAGGLESSGPAVSISASGVAFVAVAGLKGGAGAARAGGFSLGSAFMSGIEGAIYAMFPAMAVAVDAVRRMLGGSLPEIGPLAGDVAERGGRSIGETWMEALSGAIGPLDLSGIAQSLSQGLNFSGLAMPAFATLPAMSPAMARPAGVSGSGEGTTIQYILNVEGRPKTIGTRDDVLDAWEQEERF